MHKQDVLTYPKIGSSEPQFANGIELQNGIDKPEALTPGGGAWLHPDDRLNLVGMDTDLAVGMKLAVTDAKGLK